MYSCVRARCRSRLGVICDLEQRSRDFPAWKIKALLGSSLSLSLCLSLCLFLSRPFINRIAPQRLCRLKFRVICEIALTRCRRSTYRRGEAFGPTPSPATHHHLLLPLPPPPPPPPPPLPPPLPPPHGLPEPEPEPEPDRGALVTQDHVLGAVSKIEIVS